MHAAMRRHRVRDVDALVSKVEDEWPTGGARERVGARGGQPRGDRRQGPRPCGARQLARPAGDACAGSGSRSLTNRAATQRARASRDVLVAARVRAGVVRAVHVGVQGDVRDGVVATGGEVAAVREPAVERGERVIRLAPGRLAYTSGICSSRPDEPEKAGIGQLGLDPACSNSIHARRACERAARSGGSACPRRGAGGSRPDSAIVSPESSSSTGMRPSGLRPKCSWRARLAPEEVDRARARREARAGAAGSGPSCSSPRRGGRTGSPAQPSLWGVRRRMRYRGSLRGWAAPRSRRGG